MDEYHKEFGFLIYQKFGVKSVILLGLIWVKKTLESDILGTNKILIVFVLLTFFLQKILREGGDIGVLITLVLKVI